MLFTALLSTALVLSPAPAQTAPVLPPPTADAAKPRHIGGSVLPPKLIHQVEPNYPRPLFGRPKNSTVLVGLIVTTTGMPSNLHIIRSGGKAFDKNALQAVALYRFSPATDHDLPVAVEVNIDVNFQIF